MPLQKIVEWSDGTGMRYQTIYLAEQIKQHIDDHYSEPVLLAEMLKEFHYSYYHLADVFKRRYGIGPKEYLNQIRYVKAKKLLENGVEIKEARESVGIFCERNFRRTFKKTFGISPKEVKKRKYEECI